MAQQCCTQCACVAHRTSRRSLGKVGASEACAEIGLDLKKVEQRAFHRPFDQIVRAIGAIALRPGTALPQQCQGTLCEVDTATMQKPQI